MTDGKRTRGRLTASAALFLLLVLPAVAADDGAGFGELMHNGAGLLQGQRYEEAVRAFDRALEADPSSGAARAALARSLAGLGAGHLHAGRLRESREALERAAYLRPESAEYGRVLAAVLFRVGDLRGARREVGRVLELDPGDGAARELSGDLYDRAGLLNQAVGEWEAAAHTAGAPGALAAKIARGRREMAAEEGMGRESSRYFVILYEREVPRELVRGFFTALDAAFEALHDRLGDYPRDVITVILSSRTAFSDVTRAPDWAGGLYDGKIRVPVGGLATVEQAAGLHAILLHEMTHAFLHRMAPAGLPLWFNEGLATTIQGWDPARIRAWFAEARPATFATLAELDRALQGRGGNVQAAYAAARLALDEVEQARGFAAVRRIVARVGEGNPFAEVFPEEVRLDLEEFQERWRRALP